MNKAINKFIFAINRQIEIIDNIPEDFYNLIKESTYSKESIYSIETLLEEIHNAVELIVQNSQVVK